MQLSLAFITLLVVGEIAATTDYQCWNFKSTNDIRDRYLKAVNKLRTDIVNGMVEGKNGKCPAGKNIYKLFWDCLLENEAQKAVDKCDEKVQAPADLAMVIKKLPLDTCNTNPLFKKTVDEWWNVVKGVDVDQTNPPTSSSALQSFAALAHGDATRIGCAQKNCNGNLFMACMVYNKAPAEGQPIYEAGSGCSGPTECTTYQGSKCSNKMCVAGYIDSTKTTAAPQPPDQTTTPLITTPVTAPPVPTTTPLFPGDNIMCTGQTNMSSDPIRTLFVTLHNKHRSEIAKGAVIMGDGNKCRTAVHMWKLGYKCELETSAYRAAEGCYKGDSSTQGVDEVWHVFDTSPSDMNKAAEEATAAWYGQITTKGNYMMQKTGQQNILMKVPDIANFAKMVWDSHREIGCAIAKCNTATKVVCHYSPAKATYGSTIYVMGGVTCRQCPNVSGTCLADEGLCVKN